MMAMLNNHLLKIPIGPLNVAVFSADGAHMSANDSPARESIALRTMAKEENAHSFVFSISSSVSGSSFGHR
jgi:hypothetical protein